jgi:signal transduction histidine kinase
VGTIQAAAGLTLRIHARQWSRPDLGRSGFVVAAQSTTEVSSTEEDLLVVMGFYLVPAFVVTAWVMWLVVGWAMRPLLRLTELADEIGSTYDLTRRLPATNVRDTLGRLTVSFNAMLERLQEAYHRERRFTADASHELRTPLTTIRMNAEFLLQHPHAEDADRRAALGDLAEESDRMCRLVDTMLTLAKTDIGQPLPAELVELGATAERVCRQAGALHPDRSITLEPEPVPPVHGSADALAQLIWILVDNAIKHTRAGGHVRVSVAQDGAAVHCRVTDDGRGIAPGDQERIFERFYRSDPARSGSGAGLGLAIAARIASVHHGRISAANNAGGGATFDVELPVAAFSPTSH